MRLPGENRPSAVKRTSVRERAARVGAVVGIVLGSAVTGAAAEGTTHVLSKAVGKVVRTLEKADDADRAASSAGIPSEKVSQRMQQVGIPIPAKKP